LRFILDNNLSPALAEALHALSSDDGCEVRHVRDYFNQSNNERLDEYWLPALSKQGSWIVISADIRIFKNQKLRQVWPRWTVKTGH
jgi:hypothetical protein